MRAPIAGLCAAVLAGPVAAAEKGVCYVAANLVLADHALSHLPVGIAMKVVAQTNAHDTAAEMVKMRRQVLNDAKPDLVIRQTGTVDAMLGVDPDEFQAALGNGLDALHTGKADAVFVNMQYSPRTDSMISLEAYIDAMRFVALQREIPLFDRLGVMKDRNEMGVSFFRTPPRRSTPMNGYMTASTICGAPHRHEGLVSEVTEQI